MRGVGDNHAPKRSEIIEGWYELYADAIYGYARCSLPADMDASDVVQEVFLRAFRSLPQFKGENAKAWLFQIARNYIFDLLRRKRIERARFTAGDLERLSGDEDINSILELHDLVHRLQPAHQQVLLLRIVQDLSVRDTARILDWSEAKVRITFHRAKKSLRNLLLETVDELEPTGKGGEHDAAEEL